MRTIIYLLSLILLPILQVRAQTNLVLTGPGSSTPGYGNVTVGIDAGSQLGPNHQNNVFVGYKAGQVTTAINNTFLGSNAGSQNTNGYNNTFVGMSAGKANTVGNTNTFVGTSSGENNTTGPFNTFIGYQSGSANLTGNSNTYLGYRAGQQSTTANNNTFVGTNAGQYATGPANTMIGYRAGGGIGNTGQFNTLVGVQAGLNITTGSSNIMMGTNAGLLTTTGNGNFFLGDNAGGQNTSGGYNVYLGTNVGNGDGVNGSNNVAIGFEAGRVNAGGGTNTFLGFRADAAAANLINATAIGANAKVSQSNSLVLGDNANVGIGTTAPSVRLEVVSSTSGTSGLRLSQLTATTSTSLNATKFLTVNASGDVILANYTSGAREATGDLLWQRRNGYLQSTNGEALILGQDVSQLPTGYNLYVSKGILTEKVKVAVKNSGEWRDDVFSSDYKLVPLSDVADYIKDKGHLPGIPSAQEMVEQGNDLHQTDALLLAKIEELTLYMIEARRRNEQQQREIAQLKRENSQIKRRLPARR